MTPANTCVRRAGIRRPHPRQRYPAIVTRSVIDVFAWTPRVVFVGGVDPARVRFVPLRAAPGAVSASLADRCPAVRARYDEHIGYGSSVRLAAVKLWHGKLFGQRRDGHPQTVVGRALTGI